MENNKASMTALVSAFGRAYHSLYERPKIFDDYLVRQLITDEEFNNIAKNMAEGIKFFNPDEAHLYSEEASALKWVIQTQVAPTPLARSRFAEDSLENAMKLGIKQYVILGAGFDTFAFRRPELLDKISIFEVDHPATQELKLQRIKELGWEVHPSVKYVSMDFTKDQFVNKIIDAGYKPDELSFFSWLGVTYYLTREENLKMFNNISKISPKGSSIVFDYPDEFFMQPERTSRRAQNTVMMAKMSGEPMKTGYSYAELERDLDKAGMLIYEHLSPEDIEERYFKDREDAYHAFENVHYILAVVGEK